MKPETTTMEKIRDDERYPTSVGVMTDIIATHIPSDVDLPIDVRSLLRIAEGILKRTTSSTGDLVQQSEIDVAIERMNNNPLMLKILAYDIRQIRSELLCFTESGDPWEPEVSRRLFKAVSMYSWDVKLVLVLAAYAVNYGECWLTAQLYTTNSVARSISILKQLPDLSDHSSKNSSITNLLNALANLTKAIVNITETIMEFFELPAGYITPEDSTAMSMALTLIQPGVYWSIRCIMACTSYFNGLLEQSQQHMMEPWEYSLPHWDHKINTLNSHLRREIKKCGQEIENKKRHQMHENLVELFRTTQAYNTKVLKALLCSKDALPLVDGSSKTREGVEVLRMKTVMLLISDLEITQEVLILEQIYNNAHLSKAERPYEVVWLPVLDEQSLSVWTDSMQHKFDQLRLSMPWYSLYHPSLLDPAVTKYIKDQWHFDKKKPVVVVLNPQGKVTCQNAIHMVWIWGITAFPFTKIREEDLWNSEKWTIEFIVNGIDPSILNWVREEKIVCLYGGEDMNWIRKFTSTMQRVAQEAKLPLEMVYVGKSNPKEQVKKNINTIIKEKLSHCWQDPMSIWFFWVRLESMWHSKMQHSRTIDNDPLMREITTMLTLDDSNNGWAVIGGGSGQIAKAQGSKILDTLTNFNEWKANLETQGFMQALVNALASYPSHEHCSNLVLPGTSGKTYELSCAECGRPMELYVLYRCCDD